MFKKVFLYSLLAISVCVTSLFGYLHFLGLGQDGELLENGEVVANIESEATQFNDPNQLENKERDNRPKQILFGDLHVHTDYSADAALFNLPELSGLGGTTPTDACNYARYCSAIDFFSINDHAEDLTPRSWQNTIEAIEQCNLATNQDNPDLVAFLGWEWSQRAQSAKDHFGHKNVVLKEYEAGKVPVRPIAAHSQSFVSAFPKALLGSLRFGRVDEQVYEDFSAHVNEIAGTADCPADIQGSDLRSDCREVAKDPKTLFSKLDELTSDSIVIPHGLAWGTTNPAGVDLKMQLDQHDPNRQKLLEVYSGHGSSEKYVETNQFAISDDGAIFCPAATEQFFPCCKQAGRLARQQCNADNQSCAAEMLEAENKVAALYASNVKVSLKDIGGSKLEDWGQCGQVQDFMPAFDYRNKQSAQYAYTLQQENSKQEKGDSKRYQFGLIGSSDNHKARAGNGYKEQNRIMITDSKDVGSVKNFFLNSFVGKREGSFYYSGGLVAVHSEDRTRDSIWQALDKKEVYGTSGERILLWFDLKNSSDGLMPMGSEAEMSQAPRFAVKAMGAYKQKPGCPEYVYSAFGQDSVDSLCGGECYNPGDERKPIESVEVVRIRVQQSEYEQPKQLVQDPWLVLPCPKGQEVCEVEFTDPDFTAEQRDVVYYVRAIQSPTPAINGDPFHCTLDENGQCIKANYCSGKNVSREDDCLAPAKERAWSSPIFLSWGAE